MLLCHQKPQLLAPILLYLIFQLTSEQSKFFLDMIMESSCFFQVYFHYEQVSLQAGLFFIGEEQSLNFFPQFFLMKRRMDRLEVGLQFLYDPLSDGSSPEHNAASILEQSLQLGKVKHETQRGDCGQAYETIFQAYHHFIPSSTTQRALQQMWEGHFSSWDFAKAFSERNHQVVVWNAGLLWLSFAWIQKRATFNFSQQTSRYYIYSSLNLLQSSNRVLNLLKSSWLNYKSWDII